MNYLEINQQNLQMSNDIRCALGLSAIDPDLACIDTRSGRNTAWSDEAIENPNIALNEDINLLVRTITAEGGWHQLVMASVDEQHGTVSVAGSLQGAIKIRNRSRASTPRKVGQPESVALQRVPINVSGYPEIIETVINRRCDNHLGILPLATTTEGLIQATRMTTNISLIERSGALVLGVVDVPLKTKLVEDRLMRESIAVVGVIGKPSYRGRMAQRRPVLIASAERERWSRLHSAPWYGLRQG